MGPKAKKQADKKKVKMLGNSKKTKNKDFKKMKVKVGKKLPRGLNETVATFQTRTIIMRERHDKGEGQSSGIKQKVDLFEVLQKCSHRNNNERVSAINSIKNLVVSSPEEVLPHLHRVIEKTVHFLADREKPVREAFSKLMHVLLQKASKAKMRAFLPLLNTRLCSAMMNLDGNIRWHAHTALDLLLDTYPDLVCQSSYLIDNLILQMSALKSAAGGVNSVNSIHWKPRVEKSIMQVQKVLLKMQAQSTNKQQVQALELSVPVGGLKQGVSVLASNAFKYSIANNASGKQLEEHITKLSNVMS